MSIYFMVCVCFYFCRFLENICKIYHINVNTTAGMFWHHMFIVLFSYFPYPVMLDFILFFFWLNSNSNACIKRTKPSLCSKYTHQQCIVIAKWTCISRLCLAWWAANVDRARPIYLVHKSQNASSIARQDVCNGLVSCGSHSCLWDLHLSHLSPTLRAILCEYVDERLCRQKLESLSCYKHSSLLLAAQSWAQKIADKFQDYCIWQQSKSRIVDFL